MKSTAEDVARKKDLDAPYGDMSNLDVVQKLVGALLYSTKDSRVLAALPAYRDEAIDLAGQAVCANLEYRGVFYNCDGVGYILLRGQEDKPVRISPDDTRF